MGEKERSGEDAAARRAAIARIRRDALPRVLRLLGGEPAGRKWRCWGAAHKRGDKRPSGTVRGDRYRCWVCGKAGDAIDLLIEARGMSFVEALAEAARLAGVAAPEFGEGDAAAEARRRAVEAAAAGVLDALAARWSAAPEKKKNGPKARMGAYLKGAPAARVEWVRRVARVGATGMAGDAAALVEALGATIGAETRRDALYEAGIVDRDGAPEKVFEWICRESMLAIPIVVGGRVVQFDVRRDAGEPRWLTLPRRGRHLWGLDERLDAPAIVLVEGAGDRLALLAGGPGWVAPVACGVAAAGAGEMGDRLRAALRREMAIGRRVFIGFDEDVAGDAAAWRLAVALPGAYRIRWGAKDARAALAAGALDVRAAIAAAQVLGDLAAPKEAPRVWPAAPPGWAIDGDGVRRHVEGGMETISPTPIWPAWAARDAETGECRIGVAWGAATRTAEIGRAEALGAGLGALAALGAPVGEANRRRLTAWILAAEAAWRLPEIRTTTRTGWCGRTLVFGDHCLGPGVRVTPEGEKEAQIIGALVTRGDEAEWKKTMRDACGAGDGAAFHIYAAAASPLLERFGCESFIVHAWGKSSVGKTSAARVAAAWWGDSAALLESWNAKEARVHAVAGTLRSFPFILDEVEAAPDRDVVKRLVYDLANGHGTGRARWAGSVKLSMEKRWRLVVFSNGEEALLGVRAKEGQYARVIGLFGPPFSGDGAGVESLVERAAENYGHGAAWAERAVAFDWRPIFEEERAALGEKQGVERRLVRILATVAAVGRSVEEWIGGDAARARRVVEAVAKTVREEIADDGDYADRALAWVVSWIVERAAAFGPSPPPATGRLGLIDAARGIVAVLPRALEMALVSGGFEPRTVLRRWREDGRLVRVEKDHSTAKVSIGGHVARAVVLPYTLVGPLLEAVRGGEPPEPPDPKQQSF